MIVTVTVEPPVGVLVEVEKVGVANAPPTFAHDAVEPSVVKNLPALPVCEGNEPVDAIVIDPEPFVIEIPEPAVNVDFVNVLPVELPISS